MATLDDSLKNNSDALFTGFDTATAVQIFLRASQKHKGLPFPIDDYYSDETLETIDDALHHKNLDLSPLSRTFSCYSVKFLYP